MWSGKIIGFKAGLYLIDIFKVMNIKYLFFLVFNIKVMLFIAYRIFPESILNNNWLEKFIKVSRTNK